VPGWTGEYEWDGFVPFEELARIRNPDTGYIVTANNRIVGEDYPHYINLSFGSGAAMSYLLAIATFALSYLFIRTLGRKI